ncbi:XdhC family protein [Lysobacter sp. LF1]|uniref:XdhC family protein n=1 Tax=Lysobacter stagni TaxID=3045172 RepID=A0ABT6XE95_9GAMM|nr:XdhC/CoxI family protein [Lysobacter sp. LF1]MDI9238470.1 XdhC family protein [Lysobacter sp. LF1]
MHPLPPVPPFDAPSTGGSRAVLDASARAPVDASTLALVLETSGSTYVRAGAAALFGEDGLQVGWLSGGCLEPEIATRALEAARRRRVGWMEIDTRDDEDLLSGSAVGCRGRLRLALLPLSLLGDWPSWIDAWRGGGTPLRIAIDANGTIDLTMGARNASWSLPMESPTWDATQARWAVSIAAPPSVLVVGAGPEARLLLPLLRAMGAVTTLVERRPRWRDAGVFADTTIDDTPTGALAAIPRSYDAALVMHHHFELDREALAALAGAPIGFIGLLGPTRRRDDLFRVLPAEVREALLPRLHSPVGLHLGGSGPEAIALSIAAQLQRHLHGVGA